MTLPSSPTAWKAGRSAFRGPHANHSTSHTFNSLLCKSKEKQCIHHTGPPTSRRHSPSRPPTEEHCTKEHALVPWLNLLSWHGFESLHNLGHNTLNSSCLRKVCGFFFFLKKFYFIYLFSHTIQHTGSQFPDQRSFLNMKTLFPCSGHCILSIKHKMTPTVCFQLHITVESYFCLPSMKIPKHALRSMKSAQTDHLFIWYMTSREEWTSFRILAIYLSLPGRLCFQGSSENGTRDGQDWATVWYQSTAPEDARPGLKAGSPPYQQCDPGLVT